MKKLRLEELEVESFTTTTRDGAGRGTVHARNHTPQCTFGHDTLCGLGCNGETMDPCGGGGSDDPSCRYGSCVGTACGSCDPDTCYWTCGDNYGCGSVDPRCSYGDVYPC